MRPNQIMSVSLSYPVIEGKGQKPVVNKVYKELYTANGLRSLSQMQRICWNIYRDRYRRDGSYHQGTVWTWYLGHFITAYMKVNNYSQEAKKTAMYFIESIKDHLMDACIGSISEIFDGDEPLIPRGALLRHGACRKY